MFWQSFYALCQLNNTTPNAIAKKLSISSGAMTAWKNGRIPSSSTLLKIANYFNVSSDYLLGKKEESRIEAVFSISNQERELLLLYRENEEFRNAVNAIMNLL